MNQPNLMEAAKGGDANAIASLLNRSFQPQGITAKVSLKEDCLQVMLAAEQVPSQQVVVKRIHQGLLRLAAEPIKRVKVYGKRSGEEFPEWEEEFDLIAEREETDSSEIVTPSNSDRSSWLGSMFDVVGNVSAKVGETARDATTNAGDVFGGAAERVKEGAAGMAAKAGETVRDAASNTTEMLGSTTERAKEGAAGMAAKAGETAMGAVKVVGSAAGKVTEGTGYLLDLIHQNPALKQLAKAFKADWLVTLLDQVDLEKAEDEVRRLQQEYPNEDPRAIAHRLMLQKAMLAGGSGLATSLLPGTATALFAVDLVSTTLLQAEMVYQIAGIYGLNLKDPERKAEVLAIFGLSLGGSRAIEAGLAFFGNIPVAGAVIGAGSNAAMVYALGYGACRFYQAKLNPDTSLSVELEAAKVESNEYLEDAIAQETIMDCVLVHVILAGNPGKTWEEILPELQAANLSPASLETTAANLQSPAELETLLEQVNSDFAVPLLAQCDAIARLDGVITPEESQVLDAIASSS